MSPKSRIQIKPPFSTLIKIADALDTDISLLIAEDSELPENMSLCIVRKNERKEVVSRGTLSGYHYEALSHKKIRNNMEPYIIMPAFREKGVFSQILIPCSGTTIRPATAFKSPNQGITRKKLFLLDKPERSMSLIYQFLAGFP
jgi:hypothetical protein